jgi:antitoxin ParD1/3/4
MQKPASIALTEQDSELIAAQIAGGGFGSASDVVTAGLRLLEREQRELAILRAEIAEGDADFAQGRFTRYTEPGQLAADLKARLAERAAASGQG